MYPLDARIKAKGGRLRLLYEVNPMGWIVEQAGGAASTGPCACTSVLLLGGGMLLWVPLSDSGSITQSSVENSRNIYVDVI